MIKASKYLCLDIIRFNFRTDDIELKSNDLIGFTE